MIELSIIIVLYNEFEMVMRCIESVYNENLLNIETILVDNSTDKKGYKKILKRFPKIRYIQNKENIGFGKAVNVGYEKAKGKFILLLTPDTTILHNTIVQTVNYIKAHNDVGLVGCRIYSYPKKFHLSAFHDFPNLLTHLYEYNIPFYKLCKFFSKDFHPTYYSLKEHTKQLSPKHIIGAYMLLRKSAIDQTGFFDNRFHLFREETDLCKRLFDKKWKIIYLPIGGLIHYGGAKWKKTSISQALPNYMESTYLFYKKHYGILYEIFAWCIGFFSAAISIPYLIVLLLMKKLQNKPTQATQLLPCWIDIFIWHITSGIQLLIQPSS